eukprot:353388-Chlamydomonas_euryale.AAC.2
MSPSCPQPHPSTRPSNFPPTALPCACLQTDRETPALRILRTCLPHALEETARQDQTSLEANACAKPPPIHTFAPTACSVLLTTRRCRPRHSVTALPPPPPTPIYTFSPSAAPSC